ncbi:MAG: HlyD family type I secretion periplasmic adaptor subunit [Rhodobacteraceae bacterium CG17_big_fil_post_rev_8_21_14_2_50_63_15]|nr:HlyD family type I secretion periplasmic adaptor subunit [Roseovarius sp.]PIV80073.1 MAG: HlyD family type I secretion periplasmic adaptor subunit [Rhodobacteraceae bacterium CG17_big_fil_post_rev_8_21_14_2_50_63_15]
MTKLSPRDPERAYRLAPLVITGLVMGILLVAGVGGWAATARLTGAVIAMGSVTVDQNLKSVQHRDGGIVSDIAVREGDNVVEGQVLIRLDDAQTKAELSIVTTQMTELTARRARLLAERDGLDKIDFPADLLTDDSARAQVVAGERRLFEGNLLARNSQRQQLLLGVDQIGDELAGLEAQRESKSVEMELVRVEQARIEELSRKGLSEVARLFTVNREVAQILGQQGEIDAEMARARTRINEINLQIIAIDETARTEAQRELSLVETRLSELQDRHFAVQDRLGRMDIRAPIAGIVNELTIHTIGGVVSPAEVLVTIVPAEAKLRIEARIPPVSIDQVSVGQPARLRFSAFNQRTTPELVGEVVHVSAATTQDMATGERYYLARVRVSEEELAKLDDQALLPGMPVEVYVTTEERTALSYLAKPITDQFSRALRER